MRKSQLEQNAIDKARRESFATLDAIEKLMAGKWQHLPGTAWKDTARAWAYWRIGVYGEAATIATPILKLAQQIADRT